MGKISREIWRFFFFLNAVCSFLILFPAFWLFLRNKRTFPKVFKLKRWWSGILIYFPGIRYRVLRECSVPWPEPCVICPNHASYLDIIMTYRVIPHYFHFMGKAELKKVPLFNRFFDHMNILVDRSSIVASHKAFVRAGEDIDRGISIAIFPEATIPECTPEIGRLKNGAFKLAIEKQVPIVPVVFLDNWKVLPDSPRKKVYAGSPGLLRVVIHDPIPTKGMKESDLASLKEAYRKVMDETLLKYGVLEESADLKYHGWQSKGQTG
jgi:1-acyl-sn-glycerol-3-phosphate acyltransferase